MITGARHGTVSGLRRLVAFAMTRTPSVFIIPGPEIARINDLDIQAAGMEIVASPRHASVLLVIGEIPDAMREAAVVIYAQMMRPRVLLFLTEGIKKLPPLPTPDIVAGISQPQLLEAMQQLRTDLAKSAFHTYGSDFDAPILQIKIEYTCSMHPEIIQDEPGSCPKCGMDLIQREAQATAVQSHTEHQKMQDDDHAKMDHQKPLEYTCPMHPEVVEMEPGSCPKCGMNLEPREQQQESAHQHHNMDHESAIQYTCPMHPEVLETEPGSCPKCGMNLEPREASVEYTCPMHPEVAETEPGSCPKCGMNLEPREASVEYTCPMHPEVLETEPGSCPKCGMNLEPREASIEYTCPMHPDVIEMEPGSCPKCGMDLEPREQQQESAHQHHNMDHESAIQYTCPMHPEVLETEPGSCPKCGMNLEPREASVEYTCPMHPEVIETEPGSCPKCGMNLEPREASVEYTCPMHSDVIEMEPGSCPKCGMDLEPREQQQESAHQHHNMDHESAIQYTCPMHPEVLETEPASCPKCGMNLEPREASVEYTCPMHPEVAETEPGSCPKCGMNLEPREASVEYTCPMHPEVLETEPGSCPKCGMNLEPREASVEYTCPMHPDVIEMEPGSCPKCGMNLEPRDIENTSHDHASGEHGDMDMGFMSMIEMTKDLPRSIDELPMEWINVPFGPFFPGLAGGLLLTLTLDGDTVAGSSIDTLVGNEPLILQAEMDSVSFIERLASLEPLAPICYQVLACQAIENAAGLDVDPQIAKARIVAMEQERIVSHLGWLILFAEQTGFEWLLRRATILQRDFLSAGIKQIVSLKSAVIGLNKKLSRTPLLNSRTRGIARLMPTSKSENTLLGPVARASGVNNDARANNIIYNELGFKPIITNDGDARARLQLRLDEISQSLALIESMGFACNSVMNVYAVNNIAQASDQGEAEVETARGMARLQLSLEKGQIVSAQMTTPSTQHAALIEQLIDQQELGDALVAIGSLDLSPWEMRQ